MLGPLFRDRFEAGRALARQVKPLVGDRDVLVLALPRGGVPVGYEVAQALHADLDVLVVRKLGAPGHEELAVGAVAGGDIRVLNDDLIRDLRIPPALIEQATQREQQEIVRRERLYREGRPALPVRGRTVVLVDDGLATGATMLAAAQALQAQRPEQIIVAVPVASVEACEDLRRHVDQVVCAATPDPFFAVGAWYEDFSQTSDDEVRELLERAAREHVM
jgi:putative phosphoribosyl transferase